MSDTVPNTLAGFKASFFDTSRRPLTEQDIFDAGVRSGIARTGEQHAQSDLYKEGYHAGLKAAERTLTVWYGTMPESNGKTNYTAILHKGDVTRGITLDMSEYPDRVRYEADRMRWMIGELDKEPFILDYDADKHSGYVAPAAPAQSGEAVQSDERALQEELWQLVDAARTWEKAYLDSGTMYGALESYKNEVEVQIRQIENRVKARLAAPQSTQPAKAGEHKYTQADMEHYGKCYADARDSRRAPVLDDERAALPRYTEWLHLRAHGQWTDGVPAWARDHTGRMNDFTAASAVIDELAARVAPNEQDVIYAARYRFIRDDEYWQQNDRYWEAITAGGEKLDKTIDDGIKSRKESEENPDGF